jgi:hypothetical protein
MTRKIKKNMLGFQTEDRPLALASALTYWTFRCRDKMRSPANGIKTWEYLQSSIENSAIPSRTINDYLVQLSKKLIVPTFYPKEWRRLFDAKQVVLRATKLDDGGVGDLQQVDSDQHLNWQSWEPIIKEWSVKYGITERHILKECLTKSQLVALYCRLKHEEDKVLSTYEKDEVETIDV